jgi:transmembrane sensor
MKTSLPLSPAEDRAWRALASCEDHPQIDQWLAEADTVVQSHERSHTRHSRQAAWAVAATLATLAIGVGGYLTFAPDRYQTRVGEQRDVTLPDGSRVTLNTNTLLTVHYSKARRYVEVLRGEALFAEKTDSARPFEVEAGGVLTRALGTEFNIDLRGSRVTVSVLEGAVSVTPTTAEAGGSVLPPRDAQSGESAAVTTLSKGQAIDFRASGGRMQEHQADLRRIDAWRTRRLEFTDTPLPDAIDEFNRYSSVRVVVGAPELASVRVSGVFRIGDADGFLYGLREALKLETHESPGEVVVIPAAQP